jgi:hypothetical protein
MWKAQQEEGKNLHAAHHLICATVAGVMTSACTNPIWVVKTRMQLQTYGAQGNYKGFAGKNNEESLLSILISIDNFGNLINDWANGDCH